MLEIKLPCAIVCRVSTNLGPNCMLLHFYKYPPNYNYDSAHNWINIINKKEHKSVNFCVKLPKMWGGMNFRPCKCYWIAAALYTMLERPGLGLLKC